MCEVRWDNGPTEPVRADALAVVDSLAVTSHSAGLAEAAALLTVLAEGEPEAARDFIRDAALCCFRAAMGRVPYEATPQPWVAAQEPRLRVVA